MQVNITMPYHTWFLTVSGAPARHRGSTQNAAGQSSPHSPGQRWPQASTLVHRASHGSLHDKQGITTGTCECEKVSGRTAQPSCKVSQKSNNACAIFATPDQTCSEIYSELCCHMASISVDEGCALLDSSW